MSHLTIEGGKPLYGTYPVSGAKNSVLPILAACLAVDGTCVLHNSPALSDVDAAADILKAEGAVVTRAGQDLTVDASAAAPAELREDLAHKMRSSVVFLGAMLARFHEAVLAFPGGCELGPRPIDLHLAGLRRLGADITEGYGLLNCRAPGGLTGADIALSFPSVGATENLMIAASLAKGVTTIRGAAREPEILELAAFLNAAGGVISGAGEDVITIHGAQRLHGCEAVIGPDRIETATMLSAVAAAGGRVLLKGAQPDRLSVVLPYFTAMGVRLTDTPQGLLAERTGDLHAPPFCRTMPYPGFPTDAMPPLMAAATVAKGTALFEENIFACRYKQVPELCRMGADIQCSGRLCVVKGVTRLTGCPVTATDLRGGGALCVAALCADGTTVISDIHHIERGYEYFDDKLRGLGALVRKD